MKSPKRETIVQIARQISVNSAEPGVKHDADKQIPYFQEQSASAYVCPVRGVTAEIELATSPS